MKCGAALVFDYTSTDVDVFEQIKREAETGGVFDLIIDCVSSADSRDGSSYYERIRTMNIMASHQGADAHNYVVFGGITRHWAMALLLRILKINCFRRGFELFWIKMPGCSKMLQLLKSLCDDYDLCPAVSCEREFNEQGCQGAFDDMRSRRVSGKVVLNIIK